jgi:Dynamin family
MRRVCPRPAGHTFAPANEGSLLSTSGALALTTSLADLVARVQSSIVDPTPPERDILAKLDAVLARIQEARLRVALLGQFKRGKSTLLNALLGIPLLPTGITPVTAIPTYIRWGVSPRIRIEFESSREPVESDDAAAFPAVLTHYVSESENPENREQVRLVEISIDTATLSDRVILVDTPGVGSTFVHNSRMAEAVLSDCDVGVFVVSSDPSITEVELGYLDLTTCAV